MSILVIPIQVDALLLQQGTSAIGQDVYFQGLPYYNAKKGVFVNQDRPFLAESIIAQPFKNDSLFLDAGVHLHWTLPDLVTTSKAKDGQTVFPAAPNRWYVRKVKNGKVEEWIIESDYIWDAEDYTCPINATCTIPLEIVVNDDGAQAKENLTLKSGSQPYAYMGRKYTLKEWRETNNPKERYWNHIKKSPLTATGWGSLAFDTFYAHSRSVYGMHDSDLPGKEERAGAYTYTVVGWYDREFGTHQADFIRESIAEIKKELQHERYANITEEDFKNIYEERLNATIVSAGNEQLSGKTALFAIDNTFCFGYIDMTQQKELYPAAENIQVAVANTPAEAISSLLIESAKKNMSTPDRMKEEEKLEALLGFDDLANTKLDMAARLRELRHEKGFVSHKGLTNWRIVSEDKTTDGEPPKGTEADVPVPVLDDETKSLENKLRATQYRYELKRNQLNAALDALYLDWSRYMQAMYPAEGQTHEYPDVDAIRFHIQRGSLKQAQTLKDELGIYPDLSSANPVNGASGIGLTIAELFVAIAKKLNAIPAHPKKIYKLKQETGTAYWEALPPSLVLFAKDNDAGKSDLLRYSNRLTQQANKDVFLWLQGAAIKNIELKNKKAFSVEGVLQAVKGFSAYKNTFGKSSSKVNEWHTFRVEWQVELFPVATGNQLTKNNSSFDSSFITNNYALQEEDVDYTINPALTALSLHANGSVYTGASYVTNTIRQSYQKKLQGFLQTHESNVENRDISRTADEMAVYENELSKISLLGLTLTGFNEALIQQKSITRLAPADPFGFATHRDFANDVARLLNTGQGSSADPLSTFNPLRCGALKVIAIRFIDTFGRTFNFRPQQVITSTPNRISQKENWVNLLPRLCQQATMSIRWRDSLTKVDKAKAALRITASTPQGFKPSPVCGWLLPVYMNQRIEFFDAFGKHLGAITHNGVWENSVFDYGKATSEDRSYIQNVQLSNLIEWILERTKNNGFHETFISILRDTCNNIAPESRTNPSLMEIIGGTPIAVTQIAVDLFMQGTPAFDLDWNVFRTELDTKNDRNTRRFTKIRFPYSIGDFHRYNDGVVAYWAHTGGRLAGPAYFNSAVQARVILPLPATLPLGLEDEKDYRYNAGTNITELLLEMSANGQKNIYKHEFTRHYVASGSRYWDVLVRAGWLAVYQQKEDDIKRTFEHHPDAAIDDPERNFTLLMHPKGIIHLTSGILPVKKLALPEDSYKTALRTIELTFLASPVLTPASELNLSLHQDSRFEWSWLKASKQKKEVISENNIPVFDRTLQRRHFKKELFAAVWDKQYQTQIQDKEIMNADDAWAQLIVFNFLEEAIMFENEDYAFLRDDKIETAAQEYQRLQKERKTPADEQLWQQLQPQIALTRLVMPLLQQLVRSIMPFNTKAGNIAPQSLQEGWLSIKNSKV